MTVQYGVTVDVPTKALGDGKTANYVWYALYRADGSLANQYAPARIDADRKAICPVTMVKDQKYKVVFLAMYYEGDTPAYAVDAQSKTVSMPTQAQANSDKYDLFYGVDEVVDFQGAQNTNVTLNRVVAQVNFELSETAWTDLGVNDSFMSQIVISGAPASMNLWDGTFTGTTEVTYAKASIPAEGRIIGTAYCLASSEAAQTTKVNASMNLYQNDADTQPKSMAANNIPLLANKKTNLIINDLTN